MAFKDFFKKAKRIASKVGGLTIAAVMGLSPMVNAAPLYSITDEQPIVEYVQVQAVEEGANPKLTIADFKDNVSIHWGASVIQWGLDRNMVGGYPEGDFRPDGAVNEAEFATMLARYADNTDRTFFDTHVTSGHWAQEYYNSLMDFKLPLNGYLDGTDNVKNTTISRVKVAQVFAAKYGFNLGEQQAVYFLYENGLSQGRTVMNFEGYSPNAYLTRAEIVQFFKNVDNQGTKTLTFLGKQSTKGTTDADTILGIEGVALDNSVVDFTQWVPAVVGSGITTSKVGDKVVVDMMKVTTPVTIPGDKYDKYVNYLDFTNKQDVSAAPMNNSIILFKNVELPWSDGFDLGSELLISDDGQRHGVVGLEIDGNGYKQTGSFTDKKVFVELLDNLKFFQASPNQIAKAKEVVGSKYGIHNDRDNTTITDYTSSIKNSTMRIVYGDGTVDVSIYNGVGILNSADSVVKLD